MQLASAHSKYIEEDYQEPVVQKKTTPLVNGTLKTYHAKKYYFWPITCKELLHFSECKSSLNVAANNIVVVNFLNTVGHNKSFTNDFGKLTML